LSGDNLDSSALAYLESTKDSYDLLIVLALSISEKCDFGSLASSAASLALDCKIADPKLSLGSAASLALDCKIADPTLSLGSAASLALDCKITDPKLSLGSGLKDTEEAVLLLTI
jgi:hypothetical protein